MCHVASGAAYDRPLVRADVVIIAQEYPDIDREIIDAIYEAITDHHHPQPAVLVAVLELISRADAGDVGFYRYPTMPFSAMDIDSFERVQTPSMYAFHTVFESMALAQRNMKLLQQVLNDRLAYGLFLFCDCGCCLVPINVDPFETDWYKDINALRSLAEAAGTDIVRPEQFTDADWQDRNLDMGLSETQSYERMFGVLSKLPHRSIDVKALASPSFAERFLADA